MHLVQAQRLLNPDVSGIGHSISDYIFFSSRGMVYQLRRQAWGLQWFALSCSSTYLQSVVELEGSIMTNGIRGLALLTGRVAILLVFVFTMIANAATKNPPPSSTVSTFATAYNVPDSFSAAESISQTSSGGFVVGALCDAGSTSPTCNGPATVLRVDSSGNIQSQTQYSYESASQSTALNISKPTADGGAIFAGQPQFGCPAENMTRCAAIVKVDATGKVQWTKDLQFADSSHVTCPSISSRRQMADLS